MKIVVRDSHRNLKKVDKVLLADFFREVKGMNKEDSFSQVMFCSEYFEYEFAVKWFEVIAYEGFRVVGYLRCLRFPDNATKWYIGDVNVRKAYRRKGIASKMYETVFEVLDRYCDAKCVCASVSKENAISITLHKKFGFTDTYSPCTFKNFWFDPKESEFDKLLYKIYPIPDTDNTFDFLWPVFESFIKTKDENVSEEEARKMLNDLIADSLLGGSSLNAIFLGNDLAGIKLNYKGNTEQYIKHD